MILTHELIESCRTEHGGFTKATINALGLSWNDLKGKSGWSHKLIGTDISDQEYQKALDGRYVYKSKGRTPKIDREDAPEDVQKRKRNRALLEEIQQTQHELMARLARIEQALQIKPVDKTFNGKAGEPLLVLTRKANIPLCQNQS